MSIRSVEKKLENSKNARIARLTKKIKNKLCNSPFFQEIIYKFWQKDEKYISKRYKTFFGDYPNLKNPGNFNEKNNWRKINDRKTEYTEMVDKYQVKDIIAKKVGIDHTFKLLGVWDKPSKIDFSTLPKQFVLKVNHADGVIICRDKSKFDYKKAIKDLKKKMKVNFFIKSREWPYKNVKRKIIAEEYMGENLTDFKNYCFNGKLFYTFVWEGESNAEGTKPDAFFCGAYDRKWNKSPIEIDYPTKDKLIKKPEAYDEMVKIVEKMSENIPFVRVDCYIINNKVYVGELTLFPWGGFMKFKDERWNKLLGDLEILK